MNIAFRTTLGLTLGQAVAAQVWTPPAATAMAGGSWTIQVAGVEPVEIDTVSVPSMGMVGDSYSTTITASKGYLPYRYRISSGSLPRGLSLNEQSGVISGTLQPGSPLPLFGQGTKALAPMGTSAWGPLVGPANLGPSVAQGFDIRYRQRFTVAAGGGANPLGIVNGAGATTRTFIINNTAAIPIRAYASQTPSALLTGPNMTLAQAGNPTSGVTWLTLRVVYNVATATFTYFTSPDNGATWTLQVTSGVGGTPGTPLLTNAAWPLRTWDSIDPLAWFELRNLTGAIIAACDLTYPWSGNTWVDNQGNTFTFAGTPTWVDQ
jgi:hypothetical protein